MRRLEPLVAMALYLSSRRRVLARDVAETFGVSLRTVYRDVSALAKSGFPVEGTAGDGYRVTQSAFLRPLSFTTDEAEALTLATQALAASVPSPMRESLARASAKLEATLDQAMRRRVLELQARIAVPDFLPRASGPMAEVLGAIRDRRVTRIRYTDLQDRALGARAPGEVPAAHVSHGGRSLRRRAGGRRRGAVVGGHFGGGERPARVRDGHDRVPGGEDHGVLDALQGG